MDQAESPCRSSVTENGFALFRDKLPQNSFKRKLFSDHKEQPSKKPGMIYTWDCTEAVTLLWFDRCLFMKLLLIVQLCVALELLKNGSHLWV